MQVIRSLPKLLLLAALALASQAAWCVTIQGQVVAVLSGDTIRVRDAKHTQHTIRLAGLDAPEKFQAYGQRAEDSLRELVFQRYVVVEVGAAGGSPRLGQVQSGGQSINLEQLRRGFAWFAASRAQNLSEEERSAYAAAESDARLRRNGLWRDAKPIPPWEFRAGRRK